MVPTTRLMPLTLPRPRIPTKRLQVPRPLPGTPTIPTVVKTMEVEVPRTPVVPSAVATSPVTSVVTTLSIPAATLTVVTRTVAVLAVPAVPVPIPGTLLIRTVYAASVALPAVPLAGQGLAPVVRTMASPEVGPRVASRPSPDTATQTTEPTRRRRGVGLTGTRPVPVGRPLPRVPTEAILRAPIVVTIGLLRPIDVGPRTSRQVPSPTWRGRLGARAPSQVASVAGRPTTAPLRHVGLATVEVAEVVVVHF